MDGSFLGTTQLPTCAPGAVFNLPIGVDPRVGVEYAEPVVRRGELTRSMHKEEVVAYARSIGVREDLGAGGSKNGSDVGIAAMQLVVKDQIPLSEHERLKGCDLNAASIEGGR